MMSMLGEHRWLTDLAGLLRRRNRIDRGIVELIGRPATSGNIGETIAAAVFDIELTGSGTTAGYDGTFRSGPFTGRTVNVKLYAQDAGILDISKHPADMYMALVGPAPASGARRSLPMRIDAVYLFDSPPLLQDLTARGLAVGTATSVRKHHWQRGRIFPPTDEAAWQLSDAQIELLRLFSWTARPEAQLEQARVTVVGVDGAPGGWAAVELFDGKLVGVRVFRSFSGLIGDYGSRAQAIAVDMPIGLNHDGGRDADRAARAFIGPRLQSAVFPAPPRWALEAIDFAAARAMRPAGVMGVGAQSFALVKKIKEVAQAVEAGARVYEVHPEVSFRALKGAPLEWAKKTSEGKEERLELLESVGIVPALHPIPGAANVDVIDACAAAWSAHRIATKRASALPEAGVDDAGLGMLIWY